MYQGGNPIALQSQQWLVDSLILLMKEKPYEKITVSDICKKADLSRQTFYNFFPTKEEILKSCLRQEYERQFSLLCGQEALSIREVVEAFIQVLTGNQELLNVMLANRLDAIILEEIIKCVALFADRFATKEPVNELRPYGEALLSGALAQLLIYWLRQDETLSIDKLTKVLTDFLSGNLYHIE